MKLSKRIIDQLEANGKDQLIFDNALPGFGIRVAPSGKKSFFVQYRKSGRTRRLKIGNYGALAYEEAKSIGKSTLGNVAKGENPAEIIYVERKAPTVIALCERFLTEYAEPRLKPTTIREYRRYVELFIKPAIGTRKVQDISRSDIAQLHQTLISEPYQANRVLSVISKLFNLAEVWGLRPDGSNPTRHVKKYAEVKRERFLSDKELRTLFDVLDTRETEGLESTYVTTAIKMLVFTGCRLREIQTLKWDYVEGNTLTLPDSKTGPRRIPLSNDAYRVLEQLPRMPGNEFVFAGKIEGRFITDLQKPWRRIRNEAGIEDVRLHDLRHTYASVAIMNGISLPILGKLLGHTQIQTTMRYAHLADKPVRDAADLIGNAIRPTG